MIDAGVDACVGLGGGLGEGLGLGVGVTEAVGLEVRVQAAKSNSPDISAAARPPVVQSALMTTNEPQTSTLTIVAKEVCANWGATHAP